MSKPGQVAKKLEVLLDQGDAPIPLGKLHHTPATGVTIFEWSLEAHRGQLDLSPLRLPLSARLWKSPSDLPVEYQGLPGLFNDALPDGWGLYLMDQALSRLKITHSITPLTRLAFLANRAWGALSFQPVIGMHTEEWSDIRAMAEEIEASLEGRLEDVSAALLRAGSSPHGARPKIMVDLDAARSCARVSAGATAPDATSWLIKFAGRDEPEDAPLLEEAYMRVARRAGVICMPSDVMKIGSRLGFAVQRFDRMGGRRQFVHSLGGLLHFSHRAIGLDYVHVAEVMKRLDMEPASHEQAFRRAVFNAVMSVRDDHAKNFAFLRDETGRWTPSPAFDLVYANGPGGYHTFTFAGNTDRDPPASALLAVAAAHAVPTTRARQILDQVREASTHLKGEAQGLGVQSATLRPVLRRLDTVAGAVGPASRHGPTRRPGSST